ncbi:unnamed protein product [Sphagnum jensenii]|uniref:Uncharacterized protein n=1 Tax=Sphagnum jensenii TaxID=128206 RepID=A0ABP1B9N6_9BRYO
MARGGGEQENSVVWICAARGVLSDIVTWLETGELYTSSSLTNLIPFSRYKAIEAEGTMAGRLARPLQPGESRREVLQRRTMEETGNCMLSNAFPLAALVRITGNVRRDKLEQCVEIAIRNALYRLWMQAPHHGALREAVVLLTMGDFVLAVAEVNR